MTFLRLSQPTLSRQLGELEDELGVLLFKRGKNGIELTEEGLLFRKRCEEISALVEKTENDIKGENQGGPINVGAGEAVSFSLLAQTFGQLKKRMPLLTLNMVSGDSLSIFEGLRKGLFDFGLVFGDVDSSLYDSFEIAIASEWGICLRADDPLASRESLTKEDLAGRPLILSWQGLDSGLLLHWLGRKKEELDIVATYNLGYNAAFMVKEGMGYAFALRELVWDKECGLAFVPLSPVMRMVPRLVYRRDAVLSPSSRAFLVTLKEKALTPSLG